MQNFTRFDGVAEISRFKNTTFWMAGAGGWPKRVAKTLLIWTRQLGKDRALHPRGKVSAMPASRILSMHKRNLRPCNSASGRKRCDYKFLQLCSRARHEIDGQQEVLASLVRVSGGQLARLDLDPN